MLVIPFAACPRGRASISAIYVNRINKKIKIYVLKKKTCVYFMYTQKQINKHKMCK